MSKHTKGPWTYKKTANNSFLVQAGSNNVKEFSKDFQNEGDARLIAAAPKLLEALKETLSCIDQHIDDEVLGPIIEFAKQAIAKAEGEPK